MSQFIKFPTQIEPSRVTVAMSRVDEIIPSPLTNVQQVASRGNPAWVWNYEYTDLTEDERDIVQAFLMKCEGPVNYFKVTDPGDYQIKGPMSDWIDVYSGHGSFTPDVGSSSLKINSLWSGNAGVGHHITEERLLRQEWITRTNALSPKWFGEGEISKVSSLELGKAYCQRVKFFQNPHKRATRWLFRISSGGSSDLVQVGPASQVSSSDSVTSPFIAGADVNSYSAAIRNFTISDESKIGDHWAYSDYRLVRCAVVSNSENLLTQSNNFSHADWTLRQSLVDSGYSDKGPTGISSSGWKLYTDTQVNTKHSIFQDFIKINSGNIYTTSIYAKAAELGELQIQMDNGSTNNNAIALYWLNSGTTTDLFEQGDVTRAFAAIFSAHNGWYRCALTCVINSENGVRSRFIIGSGTGDAWTGNGSDGIEIYGGQQRQFPFMGQYIVTSDTAIVGSNWQTGKTLVIDGLDPGDVIKTGQRFEIVNQFYNVDSSYFERSEFKRTTSELKVNQEGMVILEFEPPIRNAPEFARSLIQNDHHGETLHNPVIFHQPELKARLAESSIKYIDKALKATDISFSIVEDLTE